VRPCRNVFALFVTLLWLVATQHCGLEAAGIFAHGCEQADGTHNCESVEHADGCTVVEGGAYKTSSGALKVSGPQAVVCLWLTRAFAAEQKPEVAAMRRQYAERPRDWVPTWRFVQRAALEPRAPSMALA
jgi:hypothetical protein